MQKTYIVAGNHKQAAEWARDQGLGFYDWEYLGYSERLQGLARGTNLWLVGNYWDNPICATDEGKEYVRAFGYRLLHSVLYLKPTPVPKPTPAQCDCADTDAQTCVSCAPRPEKSATETLIECAAKYLGNEGDLPPEDWDRIHKAASGLADYAYQQGAKARTYAATKKRLEDEAKRKEERADINAVLAALSAMAPYEFDAMAGKIGLSLIAQAQQAERHP